MSPINPPAVCYTIPVGSAVRLSRQSELRHDWKAHRTRRRLDFDEVFSFHGPELLVFSVQDWFVAIPAARTICRRCRVIHALAFDIEGSNCQLIAWPDRYGRSAWARPRRRRDSLLDVQAGQELYYRAEQGEQELVIAQVRLYRTNLPRQNGRVVTCGRCWLEAGQCEDQRVSRAT